MLLTGVREPIGSGDILCHIMEQELQMPYRKESTIKLERQSWSQFILVNSVLILLGITWSLMVSPTCVADEKFTTLCWSRVRERKTSVTVLLCGTSGCGKSTLASLLVGSSQYTIPLLYSGSSSD